MADRDSFAHVRMLLIDNYDSFTYNLVQAFAAMGANVKVYRNDAITVEESRALEPTHLVISPGPGRPEDAGVSLEMIAAFTEDDTPWIVAVRMVSEGVDIPRLAVGVYATSASTPLYFAQAIGRFVRWQAGRTGQKAYVYLPDDPRLRAHAFSISTASARSTAERHSETPDARVKRPSTTRPLRFSISAVPTKHNRLGWASAFL